MTDAARTCGNCHYGLMKDPANLMARECNGAPPTPAIVGLTPQGPQIVLLRPVLEASTPACALHAPAKPRLLVPGAKAL